MVNDFVYKELSYKIIGLLYDLCNEVGTGHKEKYYQAGLTILLSKNKISFQRELKTDLKIENEAIGKYFFDFLIENKILLELKVGPHFRKRDFEQVNGYLKAKNLKLGIIAYFTNSGVKIKRVVNIQ